MNTGGTSPHTDKRRAAERRGRRAEWLAMAVLAAHGYAILARRHKTRSGEVDLIAKRRLANREQLIVFAEVKARPTVDQAIEAVTWRARRRIEAAGKHFLARNPKFSTADVRYDIIAVTGWRVRTVRAAWREGE